MKNNAKQHGVTLIELMIVVVIIGILAAVASTSYQRYTLRAHRTEAKTTLLTIAVEQEKFFLQNRTYATDAQLASLHVTSPTEHGYYTISLATPDATTYTATASTLGGQQADTACATLTIDQSGTRTPATGCW